MLDQFNVFDYGITDDFAKSLTFSGILTQTIEDSMEHHF